MVIQIDAMHSATVPAKLPFGDGPPALRIVPGPRPGHRMAYVAFAAICVIWGTTFVAIRVAIETIPTLLVTGIRFPIAGLILLAIARLTGARFPTAPRDWRQQALAGLMMAGCGNALGVYAGHGLSRGLAALLAATR